MQFTGSFLKAKYNSEISTYNKKQRINFLTTKEGTMQNQTSNPLSELINDDLYILLTSKGLIDEKSVRDYIIRRKFKDLRAQKVSASNAIESLREEYPYLQFDTIRKIVYQPRN